MLTKEQTQINIAELVKVLHEIMEQSEDWQRLPQAKRAVNLYMSDNAYFVYVLDHENGNNAIDVFGYVS